MAKLYNFVIADWTYENLGTVLANVGDYSFFRVANSSMAYAARVSATEIRGGRINYDTGVPQGFSATSGNFIWNNPYSITTEKPTGRTFDGKPTYIRLFIAVMV